jgi:steroid 5-alpha reductase family enzyme
LTYLTDEVVHLQVGWAISASLRTEKLYDALGSSAFAACAIGTLTYAKYYHARQIVTSILVLIWAARLGGFLLFRVLKTGTDSRFDEVKDKPCGPRFR